jgi:predicted N-acetyltransferase YhbS
MSLSATIGDGVAFTIRRYQHPADFDRVGRFLIDTYQSGRTLVNWLQPRWEYMFAHPFVDRVDLTSIGIADAGDQILGLVHPEDHMAFVYFPIRDGCDEVKPALLDWAQAHFGAWSNGFGRRLLGLWVDEHDEVLAELARERDFELTTRFSEAHAQRSLLSPLPDTPIPDGYRIQSLADENDFERINGVLWRGFDHEGVPPTEAIAERVRAQDTPGFRRDLTIVAVEPGGDYVAFAGMWVVPENRIAYVEPVATDPAHRRLGLGRAAVVESLRRARSEGAETAWVGSDQEFYVSIGFEVTSRTDLYIRPLG